MPLRAFQAILCLVFWGTAQHTLAQNNRDLYRYDAQIAWFETHGPVDSFLFYANKKALLARQSDLLELWAWMQVEMHDVQSAQPAAALKYIDSALKNAWRAPADSATCEPFMYLQTYRGYYLTAIGRVWQAVEAYETARTWYERFQYTDADFEVVEVLYKPLGNHYTRLGDNEKALVVFQKALTLTPFSNTDERAGLYNNIGIACWNQGDWTAAQANYREGLALKHIPAQKRALLLTGLARTQQDASEPELAYQTVLQALRLLGGATDPSTIEYRAYAHLTAGQAATRTGQLADAERWLKMAIEDARAAFGASSRETGKAEIALARLLQGQGKLDDALGASNRALSAILPGFRPNEALDNPPVSLFYEENTIFEALQAKADIAMALYRQNPELRYLETALDCHDKAWQAEMLLRQVFYYSSSKLGLQQMIRRREASAMEVVRLLYEKTRRAEYAEKAFELAERSKAMLLAEALQDNLIRQRLAGGDPRFDQLNSLKRSAAFFDRHLLLTPGHPDAPQWRLERDAVKTRAAALEKELSNAYPQLAKMQWPVQYSFISLSNKLPDGEILAEYFVGTDWIEVLTVSAGQGANWLRIRNDALLQNLVYRFLAYFEKSGAILDDPSGYLQAAYALQVKLVPAGTAGAGRLTIIPDGFLNFIPFEALVTDPAAGTPSLRNAAYLIRRQEIRYAWSWTTLQQQNAFRSGAPNFLLGVAPGFEQGQRGLAPLGGTEPEWQAIPSNQVRALRGVDATAARLLAEAAQFRVLHLNTHAHAGADERVPPSIELFDTAVTLPDIYALPLQADLVVLSACQTGIGAEQKGEGVMSLARAFAQAGAACIVSSLWNANDRSNARIFNRFYSQCLNGLPVGAALRQAKLDYLGDDAVAAAYQTPYYWAGIVPVGAERRLFEPFQWQWWAAALVVTGFIYLFFWNRWMRRRRAQSRSAKS